MGNCGSKREPAGAASDMITIGTTDKTDAYAQLDGEGYVMIMMMIIYTCRELFFKLLLLVGVKLLL